MEMAERDLLRHLTDLIEKLGVQIRYDILESEETVTKGGYCRLRGHELLIVDKRLSTSNKIKLFLEVLRDRELDDIYVPPIIRRMIEDE